MEKRDIKKKVVEIINSTLAGRINVNDLENSEGILEVFEINSIEAVEIIVRIENEFNIEVDDEDLSIDFFESFDKVIDYINMKTK